ncbi:MAG: urease accessory protein UreD [Cyanobacteria bacterium P01_A01_bin.45]|mgnify:CR=1 FL=1
MKQICQKEAVEPSEGWHGKLNLVYKSSQDKHPQGKTTLITNQNQAPLKVQRPFYPEGQQICHSVILHTAGGVVGGDKLSCDFHLQPRSQALITTAAAAKIYRSNGMEARQSIQVQVEENACLEWLPQETIVFNGANYRQDLRVELAPGASWIGWEITRFGRSARGEKFIGGKWRNHTEIWQDNQPLWIDRQYLPGNKEVFHSPHGLAGKPVVGNLVYLGKPVSQEIIQQIRRLWDKQVLQELSSYGVTRLENGVLCRYRGDRVNEVRNWFISVWQLLRMHFLNRSECLPRVWML